MVKTLALMDKFVVTDPETETLVKLGNNVLHMGLHFGDLVFSKGDKVSIIVRVETEDTHEAE